MNHAIKLAAPAPTRTEDDEDAAPEQTQQDRDLHAVCEQWVRWRHSRRLYGPPPSLPSLLGQLIAKRRGIARPGGPDAACSAELAAFHVAYLYQQDGIDKQIFELHYWQRVKPIKAAARVLGVSRKTWYAQLSAFRKRVHALAQDLVAENKEKLAEMERTRQQRSERSEA